MKTKLLAILGASALLSTVASHASAAVTVVDLGTLGKNAAIDLGLPSLSASTTPFDIVYKFSLTNDKEATDIEWVGLPLAKGSDSNRTVQDFSLSLRYGPYSPPAVGGVIALGQDNMVPGQTDFSVPETLLSAGSYYIEAIGKFAPSFNSRLDSSAKLAVAGSLTVTAVPEVSTWAMMAFGFAALGFAGYRSRRSVDIAA